VTAIRSQSVAVQGVTKRFDDVAAVDDVSVEIGTGEFFSLLGPSGCGKTTTLRMIAGFERPDAGTILIGGTDVTQTPPHLRPVNTVFQSYALFPHLSVEQNVGFGLRFKNVSKEEGRLRVGEALELVRLGGLGQRRPHQLSGGQQQRVALARTIVIEPEVLLLDEPLSNLDARLRVEMRAELRTLQRKLGLTAIYVTHDQEEANAIADRIAVLDQGRIQQIGTPAELYDSPANRFVATFLGTANLIEGRICGGRFVNGNFSIDGIQAPDGPACISIRPQDVTLGAFSRGISAVLAEREFLGAVVRYRFNVGGQRFVVDTPHRRGEKSYAIGSSVGLIIDPRQVAVLD
jgi:iron(III) transport system ATP-binding protein